MVIASSRVVQVGWASFSTDGDVLERRQLCVSDAPPCQQRAVDVHGLTTEALRESGQPIAQVLRQFASALRVLQQDGGLVLSHGMDKDAGLMASEFRRAGMPEEALLVEQMATEGICTLTAAAAQQRQRIVPRAVEQLRDSFDPSAHAISLSAACRMYGVVVPAATPGGGRPHTALYDATLAGQLFFAMRRGDRRSQFGPN